MKRFGIILLLLFIGSGVKADEIDSRRYIYIEAGVSVSASADYATIVIKSSSKGETPDGAVDSGAKTIRLLLETIAQYGVARADIETGNFSFETVYIKSPEANSYDRPDPDRDTFDGYRVRNNVTVVVRDLAQIGDLLSGVARLGVEISSLTFSSTKAADYRQQARDKAALTARQRAEAYAKALGVTLGELLAMREGSGYNTETMEEFPVEGEADLAILPFEIIPRAIEFEATVSTKWAIADGPVDN